MGSALNKIAFYVTHFTEAIASITGVDIEVVDSNRIRVAGTGIYASSIGQSISKSGELIYNYALAHRETVFIENPRFHHLCADCKLKENCQEKLTFCTPIVCSGQIIGIIGLVCFKDEDRERLIASRDVYTYFFRQIADGIARVAENEQSTEKLRKSMDMLLKVTNSDTTCVLVLDANNRISFINDAARRELGVPAGEEFRLAEIAETGDRYSNMGEFEIRLTPGVSGAEEERRSVLGRLLTLSPDDPLYSKALVFDSKLRIAEIFSHHGNAAHSSRGLPTIVGDSRPICELKEQVLKIASTPSTVLITGESGTGKEMFARAIHAASRRGDKPFIAINCGAIPDALLESELFGYVGGAFTGASPSGRMGKFELADGGSLFLDEISSMPLYLQVKLLRVLQERNFSRLGSNKTVSVDIRVIAATNESIPDLIEQRMFREDLYYRLNVIPIHIPPLRERREDIPELAEFFLERYCRLFDKPRMFLSPELQAQLVAFPWPGNIREFENCIEYLVNMNNGGLLGVSSLPDKMKSPSVVAADSRVTSVVAAGFFESNQTVTPLEEIERLAIKHALTIYGETYEGKRAAAKALGISTATLYRKLKRK